VGLRPSGNLVFPNQQFLEKAIKGIPTFIGEGTYFFFPSGSEWVRELIKAPFFLGFSNLLWL